MTAQQVTAKRAVKAAAAAPKAMAAPSATKKSRATAALSRRAPSEHLQLFYRTIPTPVGPFSLFVDRDGAVRCCHWQRCAPGNTAAVEKEQRDVCASLQARWYKTVMVEMAPPPPSSSLTPGDKAAGLLHQYFNPASVEAGRPDVLESLLLQVPIAYPPTTAFMATTWDVLRKTVPSGETVSYKELGMRVSRALFKSPTASSAASQSSPRAIGVAMSANPIPVIVPCHRVLSSTGALRGYGLGLRFKVWLLRHEQAEVSNEILSELQSETAISTATSLR